MENPVARGRGGIRGVIIARSELRGRRVDLLVGRFPWSIR